MHQVTLREGFGGQQGGKAQALHGELHGLHMAVRQRASDLERLRHRLQDLSAKGSANRINLVGRQTRQIGQRALANLGALAIGLTQQNRRVGAPVWNYLNMQVYIYRSLQSHGQVNYMSTKRQEKPSMVLIRKGFTPKSRANNVGT